MTTDILLVDDHTIFRKGLRLLVEEEDELRVVGEAGDGQAAIELARELAPDVVVMDITMPGMDGVEATRHIVSEFPNTKVMVLSIHGDKRFVEDMLQVGAAGYVLKESAPEELVVGIRTVARGEVYLSPTITGIVVSQYVGLLAGESDADEESTRQPVAAPSVLRTKLHRPQISSRAVNRTRLLEQLEEGSQAQLALITAAAGYGKSTLVSQWLERSKLPHCWISLDQEDADLRTFLLYVTSAIQTIFEDAVPNTSTLLLAPKLPPPSELARTLLNELHQAPERFILVLDDFHRVHSESVNELLDELLRHPSPSLLLVIVTRTDPNLGLAALRASGRMLEIRSYDLRFSDDETLALLQKTRGESIDAALAAQLNRRMEGWATGLHLATLSMDESLEFESTIEDAPGEHLTLDYMLTEVLSRQPEAMQLNLMKTAILDRFCSPLCEAVCGPPIEDGTQGQPGEEFIDWLVRRNLFVIPLDHRRQWFRYHHLFQELLQERLQNALSSEEIGDLHVKASRWFEEAGLIDEAIGYALNGGDALGAADIVARRWRSEVNNDRWYVVKRWLTLLPEGSVNQRPGLLLAQAWTEYFQSQMMRIGSIIEKVESLTDEQTVQPAISHDLDFFRGCLEYWSGNGETSLQLLEGTLTELPARPGIIEGNYAIYFGLAHHMCGHTDLAVQALTDLLQAVYPVSEKFAAQVLGGLIFVYLLSGALHPAAAQARRLQLLAQKVGMHDTDAWVSYFHGYVAIHTHQLEQAQYHFTMAVENVMFSNLKLR